MNLRRGSSGTGCDVDAFHARAIRQRRQLLVGVFGRDVGLSFVGLGDEFPERFVRCPPYAVSVSRALSRPVVHLKRKVLKDEARIGFCRDQSLDYRLRRLACRTLQIAELDYLEKRWSGAADRSACNLPWKNY